MVLSPHKLSRTAFRSSGPDRLFLHSVPRSAFAMPILVLDLTGSASQAGTVLAVQRVPYLLLGLFAGVVWTG